MRLWKTVVRLTYKINPETNEEICLYITGLALLQFIFFQKCLKISMTNTLNVNHSEMSYKEARDYYFSLENDPIEFIRTIEQLTYTDICGKVFILEEDCVEDIQKRKIEEFLTKRIVPSIECRSRLIGTVDNIDILPSTDFTDEQWVIMICGIIDWSESLEEPNIDSLISCYDKEEDSTGVPSSLWLFLANKDTDFTHEIGVIENNMLESISDEYGGYVVDDEDDKDDANVNHPSHYMSGDDDVYEVIKILNAKLTKEQFYGFLKGNVLKYVLREGKKGDSDTAIEDLKKARWYLSRYISEVIKDKLAR